MKVSNDDTFTGKFNLCGITIVDFSRKVPVKRILKIFLGYIAQISLLTLKAVAKDNFWA